jgi:hypothetical protein
MLLGHEKPPEGRLGKNLVLTNKRYERIARVGPIG